MEHIRSGGQYVLLIFYFQSIFFFQPSHAGRHLIYRVHADGGIPVTRLKVLENE